MKPQNPDARPTEQIERPEDAEARRELDEHAAEKAMESTHQAFAGSADGVGSVEFDDRGAFGVGARVEKNAPADPGEADEA